MVYGTDFKYPPRFSPKAHRLFTKLPALNPNTLSLARQAAWDFAKVVAGTGVTKDSNVELRRVFMKAVHA